MISATLRAMLAILGYFALAGCATLDGPFSLSQSRGQQREINTLNAKMAERQRILPLISRDANGLQQTRDIAREVESQVAAIRIRLGDRSASWPEYRAFADRLRTARREQLDALLPIWREGLRTGSPVGGTAFLILDGDFTDIKHPAYPVAIAVERRASRDLAESADKHRRERIESGFRVWAEQGKIAAEEKRKRAADLIAKGICPVCEGSRREPVYTERDCASCGGSKWASANRLCLGCAGTGKNPVTKYKTCSSCAGSGAYKTK